MPKEGLGGLLPNSSPEDIQEPDIQDKGIRVHNLGITRELSIHSPSQEVLPWVSTLDSIQVEAAHLLRQQVPSHKKTKGCELLN